VAICRPIGKRLINGPPEWLKIDFGGYAVRHIGYKKNNLGPGKSPLAADRKINSSLLFLQRGDRKTH
jgi:hypothetical protein